MVLQQRIEGHLSNSMLIRDINSEIDTMLTWFNALDETQEMILLREEAGRLGDQSNTLFGVRSEGR